MRYSGGETARERYHGGHIPVKQRPRGGIPRETRLKFNYCAIKNRQASDGARRARLFEALSRRDIIRR